jgi:hypothetical protein
MIAIVVSDDVNVFFISVLNDLPVCPMYFTKIGFRSDEIFWGRPTNGVRISSMF